MHGLVLHRNLQEFQAKDLTDAQEFGRLGLAAICADGIAAGRYYSGLNTIKYDDTQIRVAPGRYWENGQAYDRPADPDAGELAEVIELSSWLPISQKRILALAVWGREAEVDSQQRHFLDNVQTGAGHFAAVPVTKRWDAVVEVINGNEAGTPILPSIPDGMLHFATVWLDPSGIYRVEMVEQNKLPNLSTLEFDLSKLLEWMMSIRAQVDSLKAAIAALSEMQFDFAKLEEVQRVMADVALLKDYLAVGDEYSQYSADTFVRLDESDPTQPDYDARVDNGLLFPAAAIGTTNLQLLSPNDAGVSVRGDVVLPAFDSIVRFATAGHDGSDVGLSVEAISTDYRTIEINTYKSGQGLTWNQYERWWLDNFSYIWDMSWNPDYFKDSSFIQAGAQMSGPTYPYMFWSYFNEHWELEPIEIDVLASAEPSTISGAMLAQSFVSPGMWLTEVGLYFTQLDSNGSVTVLVLGCADNGKPSWTQGVYAETTLARGQLSTHPDVTRFALTPTFLETGKRYAIIVVSSGAHRLATVPGKNNTEGSLFTASSAGFFEGDTSKDLLFDLYAAQFRSPRTVLSLQPTSLAGGIADLKAEIQKRVPSGCELEIQYQVAGTWYSFATGDQPLASLPNLLPLRAVFLGTQGIQPALVLTRSNIEASRPKTALTHLSTERSLGAATDTFLVLVTTERFDSGSHSLIVSLVEPDGTEHSASVTEIITQPDGSKQHRCDFALAAPISTYRTKIAATRAGESAPLFSIANVITLAL